MTALSPKSLDHIRLTLGGLVKFSPIGKQLAAAALWASQASNATPSALVAPIAQAILGRDAGASPGKIRKNISEARAVLRCMEPACCAPKGRTLSLEAWLEALRGVSVRQAGHLRSAQLQGTMGGRPRRGRRILAAIERLVRDAQGGSQSAWAELAAIRDKLNSAPVENASSTPRLMAAE